MSHRRPPTREYTINEFTPTKEDTTNQMRHKLMKNPSYAPDKPYYDVKGGDTQTKVYPPQPEYPPRRILR